MKSRISFDVDYNGQPEIVMTVPVMASEMRDKIVSKLVDQIKYPKGYTKKCNLKTIPANVFVVKEDYQSRCSSIDQTANGGTEGYIKPEDRIQTFTLVPINRIEYEPLPIKADGFDEIRSDINEIKSLLNFLDINSKAFDRLESLLNRETFKLLSQTETYEKLYTLVEAEKNVEYHKYGKPTEEIPEEEIELKKYNLFPENIKTCSVQDAHIYLNMDDEINSNYEPEEPISLSGWNGSVTMTGDTTAKIQISQSDDKIYLREKGDQPLNWKKWGEAHPIFGNRRK